jgi:hypothetical protein
MLLYYRYNLFKHKLIDIVEKPDNNYMRLMEDLSLTSTSFGIKLKRLNDLIQINIDSISIVVNEDCKTIKAGRSSDIAAIAVYNEKETAIHFGLLLKNNWTIIDISNNITRYSILFAHALRDHETNLAYIKLDFMTSIDDVKEKIRLAMEGEIILSSFQTNSSSMLKITDIASDIIEKPFLWAPWRRNIRRHDVTNVNHVDCKTFLQSVEKHLNLHIPLEFWENVTSVIKAIGRNHLNVQKYFGTIERLENMTAKEIFDLSETVFINDFAVNTDSKMKL